MGFNAATSLRFESDMKHAIDTEPPKWSLKLLRFFVKKEYVEEIEGDMEEIFNDNVERFSLARQSGYTP